LQGLVAQGRTVVETLEVARNVARKPIAARREREGIPSLPTTSDRRDYTIVVAESTDWPADWPISGITCLLRIKSLS